MRIVQELRWHPLLSQWVMVSSLRDQRPWRPPEGCPFCPGAPETGTGWRVKIVENRYPMLAPRPPEPTRHHFYRTAPARGKCLVLIETPEHEGDLDTLALDNLVEVIEAVKVVIRESAGEGYRYVFWFRNKGEEIGVSQPHPHSQIYVMNFVPSIVEAEIESSRRHEREHGECLICRILAVEEGDGDRVVLSTRHWLAFIPFFARWPFEVHIYPRRHVMLLTELNEEETSDLALVLKRIVCGLNRLFDRPMPYMLALHQSPLDYDEETELHMHIEVYGVYRSIGKLKYAAGMESAGGNFTYDSTPERNAGMLREALKRCQVDKE